MLELDDESKIIFKNISDERNMFLVANFPSIQPRRQDRIFRILFALAWNTE